MGDTLFKGLTQALFFYYYYYYLKYSKTHTNAAPVLLKKGAEIKMKLQDLKLLIKMHKTDRYYSFRITFV